MGFIGYFVKLIHIPMCVMTSTYPFSCPHLSFQKQYSCVRPILYDHFCSPNNRLSCQRWSLIFCRVLVINNLLVMDHTKRQDPVCHIQTKRGPLSHRIVESIAVLTESGLRNTGMLSRERLSSDLRFFFQKCQTRKTYRMLFRERLTHSTGYHTTFCVPRTTAAANGAMLQSAKSSHECYETTGELPVSLQAMQKSHLPEANSDYAAQISPSVQTMIFSRTYPRVITEYTLNNATRTTSTSEVVLFANGNTLLICLRIRI